MVPRRVAGRHSAHRIAGEFSRLPSVHRRLAGRRETRRHLKRPSRLWRRCTRVLPLRDNRPSRCGACPPSGLGVAHEPRALAPGATTAHTSTNGNPPRRDQGCVEGMALSCGDTRSPDETPQVRMLLSGAAVQTTGKLITLVLQLVCLVFVTRLLGHGGFGDLAAGLAAAGIVEAVGEFGLTSTLVLRFGEGHHPRLVVRSGVWASFATIVFGLVLVFPIAFTVLSVNERLAFLVLLPCASSNWALIS